MATGLHPNGIHSLVIFNEIKAEYSLTGDIECRFYVDPSLDTCLDKIGLYRIGWTHKQDFVVIRDVHNCSADEFDERRLVFPISELSEELVREGVEYQFCYFHPFGDRQKYQLCGRSETFRFVKPMTNSTEKGRRNGSPSAPEMSIHYPILNLEGLEINRTVPKRVYDLNDRSFDELFRSEENYFASTPKDERKSFVYEIEAKEKELEEMKERFHKQMRIKDMEIEKLNTSVRLAEEKVLSLEYELRTKVENELKFEAIHNELMDSIRVTETKNCSLEEELKIRDNRIKTLEKQFSSQERLIDELRHKLAVNRSELDLYQSKTIESIELEESDVRQENRQLRDRLQEVTQMSEKLKESNDRLIREKRVFDRNKVKIESELEVMRQNCADLRLRLNATEEHRTGVTVELRAKEGLIKKYADIIGRTEELTQQTVDDLLSESRTAHNSGLYIFANEMTEEVKDFCVEQTTEAIKKYSDIKSMADYIVYAMDERFGNSWYCFIGQDFAHNSLLHVFGTYFSFAINDHKIIIYKTNDVPDSCQLIRWAKETPQVAVLFKTENTDHDFEDLVVETLLESISEEFVDYYELSSHLTRVLNSKAGHKYGFNWFAICGESDRFDSNLLLFSKKYKFIELEINLLKVIVIQFDEKVVENTNSLFNYKTFGNK